MHRICFANGRPFSFSTMRISRGDKRQRSVSHEESPFWISLADLMTGMTTLFLLLTCVALSMIGNSVKTAIAGTQNFAITDADRLPETPLEAQWMRHQALLSAMDDRIDELGKKYGFTLDRTRQTVDLDEQARFPLGSDRLSAAQQSALRGYIKALLQLTGDPGDPGVPLPLKSISIVGYTDPTGSYLANLDLSARRSERLMCVLLSSQASSTPEDAQFKRDVLRLFRVSGYSAAAQKSTPQSSRRLELKLDFFRPGEAVTFPRDSTVVYGECPL